MLIFQITVSFLIAALSGMGVGGGGLFVIYLALTGDTPQLTAQGMNLLFFLFSAGASALVHLSRRRIFGKVVLLMALSGIVGSLLGTALTSYVSEGLLRKSFGFLLVVGGILALRGKGKDPSQETQ